MTKDKEKLAEKTSDMQVIMVAKDLCTYIMTVTQKSPKQFRFTFVSRLQNLSLSIIENLYRANETFIADRNSREQIQRRLDLSDFTRNKFLRRTVCVWLKESASLSVDVS